MTKAEQKHQSFQLLYGRSGQKEMQRTTVAGALAKLGGELVMRAHTALEHSKAGDWNGCFFALAFGPYGELNQILARGGSEEYNVAHCFERKFGIFLTQQEVWAVVEAFDHCRGEFQALVEEYLELNYTVPAHQVSL